MKTMKKLQVAIAAASLFAVTGTAMALSISQSGVTIAREAISKNPASTQTLRGPTITVNFDNGPTANAASSQDFNVTLKLGGDGTPTWDAQVGTYKAIAAYRRNNGNAIVSVTNDETNVGAGQAGLVLLGVDTVDATTLRFRFRLTNNTGASVGLGDLQLVFNGINPGVGAAPFNATVPAGATVATDYALVGTLSGSVGNNPPYDSTNADEPAGRTGSVVSGCGEDQKRITVTARNYIGSGAGVEGESSGALATAITNNGYIVFATALDVDIQKGSAINRTTDPTTNHTQLTTNGVAGLVAGRMPLGQIKFTNVPSLDAWDTTVQGAFYKFRAPGGVSLGDFGTAGVTSSQGDVDVGNAAALAVTVTATNGFASGVVFQISDTPECTTTNGGVQAGTVAVPTITTAADGSATAKFKFSHAALDTVYTNTLLTSNTVNWFTAATPVTIYGANTTDRSFLCMIVPGGATQIPLSSFSGQAVLLKDDSSEEANASCVKPLAGLGGGVKVDVRNFFPYDPANPENQWVGVVRVINNSETTPADLTGQYIRADGKYGKWGSLGTLPARGAIYFTNKEIYDRLTSDSSTAGADNSGAGGIAATGGEALPRNTRLRISSNAASTLRVQSYIYNAVTQALVEVSASQGADFVNIEASPRDHVDQDAQTGIKK